MSAFLGSSACMLSIPKAFPFFRCFIASFISALLGSDVSVSFNLIWSFYFSYAYWVARVLSGKCLIKVLIPLLGFAFFIIKDVTILVLCSSTLPWSFVSQYFSQGIKCLHVLLLNSIFSFICKMSVHRLIHSNFLLTSQSFFLYSSCHLCFSLSDLAPTSFCLMAFRWSIRAHASWLNHGSSFFLYPSTSSAVLVYTSSIISLFHSTSSASLVGSSTSSNWNLFFSCMLNLLHMSLSWSFCVKLLPNLPSHWCSFEFQSDSQSYKTMVTGNICWSHGSGVYHWGSEFPVNRCVVNLIFRFSIRWHSCQLMYFLVRKYCSSDYHLIKITEFFRPFSSFT